MQVQRRHASVGMSSGNSVHFHCAIALRVIGETEYLWLQVGLKPTPLAIWASTLTTRPLMPPIPW